MQIIIVGGGLVGSTLAAKLSGDGHDVILVEGQAARAQELKEQVDARIVVGNGATAPVLRQAGVEDADLVVAVTDSDEANMSIGLLATMLFRVDRVVVRLRDPGHAEGFRLLSREHPGEYISVNPESAAVDRIFSLLEVPAAVDVMSFMEERLLVAGFRIREGSDFAGLSIAHMRLLFPATATLVAAVQRGDRWLIPGGDEELRAGDLAYFAIDRKELDGVLALMDAPRVRGERVMIAGATRIGIDLARRLEKAGRQVILIEERRDAAGRAEEQLGDTLVVVGVPTDRVVLEEEGVERVGTFVALTADHEVNLVASLLAKRLGARRAFALVDNPALANLIGEIGIDAVISPRLLAISLTLQQIRRGRIRSVAALLEDRVEVVEAEAEEGSPLTAGTLAEIELPRGVLVAALRRGDDLLLPGGNDRIEPGDHVLIFTTTERAADLDRFLSGR